MKIGFTGTRIGMSMKQTDELRRLLRIHKPIEFHHGDCIGADEQAHQLARELSIDAVIHPPTVNTKRAFCSAKTVLKPKSYLSRNHDIVDACNMLIAAPAGPEILRSGTWATIRYARKVGKRVCVLTRVP